MMTAIPVTLASILSIFYIPESPKWLMLKGRRDEACKVMRNCINANGGSIGEFNLVMGADEQQEEENINYLELINKENLPVSAPLWVVWTAFGFTYYGIVLYASRIFQTDDDNGGKCNFDYQAIFVDATSETFGLIICLFVVDALGRRKSQITFYFLSGIFVFLVAFGTSDFSQQSFLWIARCGVFIGSVITWVMTPELYDTHLRTMGHSVGLVVSKLGAGLSPFTVSSSLSPVSLGIIFGIVNIIASGASIFLKETFVNNDQVTGTQKNVSSSSDSVDSNISDKSTEDSTRLI